MNGHSRVLELLESLRQSPQGDVLHSHVARLLAAEAEEGARLRAAYGRLLTGLAERLQSPAEAGDGVAGLMPLLQGRPSAQELEWLAAEILRRLPARPDAPATPASSKGARPVKPPKAGDGLDAQGVNTLYRRHLDERSREIDELQHQLDEDIQETARQNEQAGTLLEGLLSRLQLAGEMPELEWDTAVAAGEIEQLLDAYRGINDRLAQTRQSLRYIANDTRRMTEELSRVRTLSLTDELTRLANRRAFLRDLEAEIARAERYKVPFSVAMLDLDRFKQINDVHGHAAGDEVLKLYANQALAVLRRQDVVARFGGEEFVVLMPNTVPEGALAALGKVRGMARELRFGAPHPQALPTFSAGVTDYRPGDSVERLLHRADQALYRAKHNGRDRFEVDAAGAALSEQEQAPCDQKRPLPLLR